MTTIVSPERVMKMRFLAHFCVEYMFQLQEEAAAKTKRVVNHPLMCKLALLLLITLVGSSVFLVSHCMQYMQQQPVDLQKKVKSWSSESCDDEAGPCRRLQVPLPRGIVVTTSDLEMSKGQLPSHPSKSLLAIPAGINQKQNVNNIVTKFPLSDYSIMIFHYDGIVDQWMDVEWSSRAIHVSAIHQTKWWYAKRFLHPDIVAEYDYIFLWDEDLGVENFHVKRYMSIVKGEGLEISQPALDPTKSRVHHKITKRNTNLKFHRRIHQQVGGRIMCDENSTGPPCTGWVEIMAPVFSRASWRCVWYMIQNDLVHAWGLDYQLGYCAQGDRTMNVGVVDSEYVVHSGILITLGTSIIKANATSFDTTKQSAKLDFRRLARRQSRHDLDVFKKRWKVAADEDDCWNDPYYYYD